MINISNVINILRLPQYSYKSVRNVSTYVHPLYFRATSILLAEPLRKKKRMDPAILRAKEDRKKKKLEKQIRYLEKRSGVMKPIMEIDVQAELVSIKHERSRDSVPLSTEEIRNRQLLEREWSKYKKDQWLRDSRIIKSIMLSQENALKELKAVSTQLYEQAIQFDDQYLPYNVTGPLYTPPINDYDSPDGEYKETTVKYTGET